MKIIILQHIKIEDPGYIKDLMLLDGVNLTTIELDEGDKIPRDLSEFDAMFCMGGPMDTWMEKDYPWLIEEKKKIKEFVVDLNKPYLGFCLGFIRCKLIVKFIFISCAFYFIEKNVFLTDVGIVVGHLFC